MKNLKQLVTPSPTTYCPHRYLQVSVRWPVAERRWPLALRFVFALVLVLLVTPFALDAPAAGPAEVAEESWIKIQTEHFTLLGNATRKTTTQIGDRLEQLWQVMAATFADVTTRPPTWIYVFRNEAAIAPFKLGADGRPDTVAGYYLPTPLANYLAIDASAEAGPFRTVYHEFIHYFVHNNLPYLPLWLNEGLAEYYSTIRLEGDQAVLGLPIDEYRRWLSQHDLLPLPELFQVGRESPAYHAGVLRGTFYAESWALTHDLMSVPDKRRMQHLIRELRAGTSSEDALVRAFELELPALEHELATRYASQRQLPTQIWRFAEWEGRPAKIAAVAAGEIEFHLGNLLVHQVPIQFALAEQYLRAALAADSTRAEAYASLGQLHHAAGRYADSHALYERALALAPNDPALRLGYGLALIEECFTAENGQPLSAETTPPLLLQARAELRPLLAQPLPSVEDELAFGRTFLLDRKAVEEGIAALTTVVAREPWRLDAVRDLIALTAHAGDLPGARSLLERSLRPRGSDELVHQAELVIADEERRAMSSAGE
ncbi:MAG TPA: tetratricopeptide repeat protein [Candidatus Udaeobacter sp.]|nr:tetratricopeptide repeat protein [Candidatus Udaeobacter sp.]